MCLQYDGEILYGKVLGRLLSFVIIGINVILKNVIILLITKKGYHTNTDELSSITRGVFIA